MATSPFTPEQEARINDLLVEYLAENGASIDEGINVIELTGDALTDENLKKLTIPSILPDTKQWAYTSLQNMMVPIQHAISHLQTEDAQVQETISDAEDATSAANTAAQGANTAAGNANDKATQAGNEADRAKNMNDHPPYVGDDDYWYLWDYDRQQYIRGEYARGAAATIDVGSVSTLEPNQRATVQNVGTEGRAVFNFGIPRGEQGEKGVKGDKGDDLDYSTMTAEEKSELNDTIVQHIVSENILGPTYDEEEHGFDFPPAMHVQWDAEDHGFNI